MTTRRRPSPSKQLALPVKVAEVIPAEVYASRIYELEESLADLEMALHEPSWIRFTAQAEQEFSRAGLQQIAAICRLMAIKNPLIRRGLALRTAYVWGQGVTIMSPADGKGSDGEPAGQDVNTVVQNFLDDPSNKRTFSSGAARESLERTVYTDGNLFLALFTNPSTGRVQVRVLPTDEISDVVTNPDDQSEPWYYRREWTRFGNDASQERITEFYPALGYQPTRGNRRPSVFRDKDGMSGRVHWDAPMVHVKVNPPTANTKFGVPDSYAAVDWARAFKEFLEDWSRYMKALTLFVWRITNPGNKKPAIRKRAADALGTDPTTGLPLQAGATALTTPNASLEAIPKTGASIDADSARPLAYMVAAALDVPVTMLLSDPGLTGARAVAESLDAPTEMMAQGRRNLWTDIITTVLDYVIDQSIAAPQGALKGKQAPGPYGEKRWVLTDVDDDRSVEIDWPDLDDVPMETVIKGIVDADSTGKVPPKIISKLLMTALGVSNVDEALEDFASKLDSMEPGLGQKVVDAFRRGQDPARAIDPEDDDEDEDPPVVKKKAPDAGDEPDSGSGD